MEERHLVGLTTAAVASVAAGAVHAAATGIHAEHPVLARLFVAVSIAQLAPAAVAMIRPGRWVAGVIAAVNAVAVAGWLLTRVSGISWIDGLQLREAPQFADTACAVLGAIAFGAATAAMLIGWQLGRSRHQWAPALVVTALAVPAMVLSGTHEHEHEHAATSATAGGHDHTAPADPAPGGAAAGVVATTTAPGTEAQVPHEHPAAVAGAGAAGAPAPAASAAVPTVLYDPAKPIDLGGVAGVSPAQQAAAENLVAINVVRLPQWADPTVAEAAGFHSIGDGLTGFEHYINWNWINDSVFLDPDHPESLVFRVVPGSPKQLVSAMYMLPDTVALTDVPDVGGALMQWHIHDNLCFTTDLTAPQVAGIVRADGSCPSGLLKFRPAPMIHVWITPNACGPFAALEGVGAGQIAAGQTRLCDHVHGDGLL